MGIHYFSYFCSENIDCGYSLDPPVRFEQTYEKYQNFLSEKFHFLVVNFSVY